MEKRTSMSVLSRSPTMSVRLTSKCRLLFHPMCQRASTQRVSGEQEMDPHLATMQSIIDLLGLPNEQGRGYSRSDSSVRKRAEAARRTDDDGRLAGREFERGRDGAAARVEGAVRGERRVLVRQDKVAAVVVHDAHVGRRELAVVDVRVEPARSR
jgi:hypothetical protein